MGVGCSRHHAPAGEAIAQQVGEQEGREMVQRERALKALAGLLARGEQGTSVVGEHVDVLMRLAYICRKRAHVCPSARGRRRAHAPGAPPPAVASLLAQRSRHALVVAAHERQLGTLAGELDRGGLADAARGSGEQHESHPRSLPARGHRASARAVDPAVHQPIAHLVVGRRSGRRVVGEHPNHSLSIVQLAPPRRWSSGCRDGAVAAGGSNRDARSRRARRSPPGPAPPSTGR